MNRLKELFDDHETGMSQFQDDYFVTYQEGGTLFGMYQQAVRELYRRFRGLRELTCKYERELIKIEKIKAELVEMEDGFDKQLKEVDLKEKIMMMEEAERAIKDTKREFMNFYRQSVWLKDQIGPLTPEKKEKLEREMWEHKLKTNAVVDWITTGRLRNLTYEMLHAMPDDMKLRIAAEFRNPDALIEWYETKEQIFIPDEFPQLELDLNDVKLLLE